MSAMPAAPDLALQRAFADHPRQWEHFHFVYPVISRRSGGLSIGINLNPDKVCNFDCVYCCVDRTTPATVRKVDLSALADELEELLELAVSGEIWQHAPFTDVPASHRRLSDIAFSGDGEPTAYPRFGDAVRLAANLKAQFELQQTKLVLITNATLLHRPAVREALQILDANHGEVWAKLDAGDEATYRQIDRSRVPLQRVLENILTCGREREVVIQSMFLNWQGKPISDAVFDAYVGRLAELLKAGCRIKEVHLYTIARRVAEPEAAPLLAADLDGLAARLKGRLPDLPVAVFPGSDAVNALSPDS